LPPVSRATVVIACLVCLAEGAIAIDRAPSSGAAESPVPAPVLGHSETLTLIAGTVGVRVAGATKFAPLSGSISVPDESEVEASHGHVRITVATPVAGQTATVEAYDGRFLLHQDPLAPAVTHLTLSQALSNCGGAPTYSHGGRRGRGARGATDRTRAAPAHPGFVPPSSRIAVARAHGAHLSESARAAKSRHLWASDSGGSWGTSGGYISTTVEGTRWLTTDECHRSRVAVAEGVVLVHDLVHHTTTSVAAGHEYVAVAPPSERAGHLPPLGEVLTGESGGDPGAFQRQVGKHVAVFGYFGSWGAEVSSLLGYVREQHARLLLHLSTDIGYGGGAGEEISPGEIAHGQGDGYLVSLGQELSGSEAPVYLALLPEMNQANNAYSAFNANGSPRGAANSTAAFRQAWRRAVLIIRGGAVSVIDRRLHALGMPPVDTSSNVLPSPPVSFMWAPQTEGTPNTPANSPAAYYPGGAYVDIVGTDFYSAFPNFRGLQALYSAHPTKPFGFNEWAMWRSGDPGFVRQLFAFVRSHRRIGLMVYNEGLASDGPFRLERFPAASAELRRPAALAEPSRIRARMSSCSSMEPTGWAPFSPLPRTTARWYCSEHRVLAGARALARPRQSRSARLPGERLDA
jgi:hypothetical protein